MTIKTNLIGLERIDIQQYYELQEPHQVFGFGGYKKNTLSNVISFNLSLISFTDLFSKRNDIKKSLINMPTCTSTIQVIIISTTFLSLQMQKNKKMNIEKKEHITLQSLSVCLPVCLCVRSIVSPFLSFFPVIA